MFKITGADISAALGQLDSGLSRYCWIQRHVTACDVTMDAEFQKRFNGFYRVRRGQEWRSSYYALMQAAKDVSVEFPEALDRLHHKTGRMEASFASKLVATLDPSKPVIDSVVLTHFGLRLPYLHATNRQAKIVRVYGELSAAHAELAISPLGSMITELFDEKYPKTSLTPLKKMDLVLWQNLAGLKLNSTGHRRRPLRALTEALTIFTILRIASKPDGAKLSVDEWNRQLVFRGQHDHLAGSA